MSISRVDVANRALTKLGEARITSFSDNSKAARDVNHMFDIVLAAELRSHNWSFSVKRVALAALAAAPEFGWSYQYQLPADCVRVLGVGEYFYPGADLSDYRTGDTREWIVEAGKVLTDDAGPVYLRYSALITDTTVWDTAFVDVFACRLAAELAESLSQSGTKRELAWKEYKRSLIDAIHANAVEQPPCYLPDDTWGMARL